MHGPYRHQIRTRDGETVSLEIDLAGEQVHLARRFYPAAGAQTMRESHQAAVFTAAALVLPGESVEVETIGRVGTEPRAKDAVALRDHVRRDQDGSLLSTLGSKFNERRFVGA